VDVRVLSATNTDLKAAVKERAFREDLFYRLNVVQVRLPPLRERRADIPLLAAHFIRLQNEKFGTRIQGLLPEALEAMCAYPWPGNIRQLRNALEASIALETGNWIGLSVLKQFIDVPEDPGDAGQAEGYAGAIARFEAEYLRDLLRKNRGNVDAAAAEAGINIATLYRKIKKYAIRKEDAA
jgi:DNA-binding NtrC family response regulator